MAKRGRKSLPGIRPTAAERNAKSILAHTERIVVNPPGLLRHCIPRERLEVEEIEHSGAGSLALYDKLLSKITLWCDALDPANMSVQDGMLAFRLMASILNALMDLRIKIGEERMAEARDVTSVMQENLKPFDDANGAKIKDTLDLLQGRFEDSIKPN
jgi:hypothetical protein